MKKVSVKCFNLSDLKNWVNYNFANKLLELFNCNLPTHLLIGQDNIRYFSNIDSYDRNNSWINCTFGCALIWSVYPSWRHLQPKVNAHLHLVVSFVSLLLYVCILWRKTKIFSEFNKHSLCSLYNVSVYKTCLPF